MLTTTALPAALDIPALTHEETGHLAPAELERVTGVVMNLQDDDWLKPTDCTEWRVREMVSHLAGSCAAFASWGQHIRLMVLNPYMLYMRPLEDAINRRQVEDRANRTPAELIAELRRVGPRAIRVRQGLPAWLRSIRVPLSPLTGMVPISYLTNDIYLRDEWMHRADLCRATGQTMQLTPEHDGRIVALVLRDVALKHQDMPNAPTIDLHLTGDIQLDYRFGSKSEPDATVTMDIVEFNRMASRRITPADGIAAASITGDRDAVRRFFDMAEILY